MQKLFFLILSLCILAGPVYAQQSMSAYDDTVQVLDEVDYDSIATMLKLEETIPISEDNCYRIRKNRDQCRCENIHLYDEYKETLAELRERHPDWEGKTMSFDFYQDGVTYQGEESYSSLSGFTEKVRYLECDQMDY